MSIESARHRALRRGVLLTTLLCASLLAPARGGAQQRLTRSAVVVDATTGRPLAAASVTAGNSFTLTAADGSFTISVPAETESLRVQRVGYSLLVVEVNPWTREIRLEPAPYLLERLSVDVRRGTTLAAASALAVASVDRAALDAAGGTSVAEALTGVGGVEDSRVGSWGSRPVIRGLSGERVAVLIDGNRVNRGCTFGMDQGLASIDPSEVKRVEILSGPGSTLYGSGNIGGVINVVTRSGRRGSGTGGEVRAGGSTAVPGGTAGVSVWTGTRRVSVSGMMDASSYGDYRIPGSSVDGSSYRQWTGDAKIELRPTSKHLISVKGQRYEGRDIGWPMMRGAKIPEETRTTLSVDYGWQVGHGPVDAVSVRAFRQRLDHHMTVDAVVPDAMGPMTMKADAVSNSTTSGARVQARLAAGAKLHADVGGEVNRWFAEGTRWNESQMGMKPATSTTFHTWPAVSIGDFGAFFQGSARLSSFLDGSLGVRVDGVRRRAEDAASVSETVTTGNVGVRADLGWGFAARASVGTGYRTPDPMELYGLALKPDGFVYRGRPDLATERNVDAEVALAWTDGRADLEVTLFHNHIRDMVSPRLVQGDTVAGRPVREYTTLGSATLRGFTGHASLPLFASLEGRVGASYTRGTAGATGLPLPAIPPLTGEVALRRIFRVTPFRWVEVEVEGAVDQNRVSTAAGETSTPGYGVANLRSGLEVGGVRITAGVENLFDRTYRSHLDPVSLYRPGRNLFVRMAKAF